MPKFSIRGKVIKLAMSAGKKSTAERSLLKAVKLTQVLTAKQAKKQIRLAVVFSTPILKLHQKVDKRKKSIRNSATVIVREQNKAAFAIKSIISDASRHVGANFFYSRLVFSLVLGITKRSVGTREEGDSQRTALLKRRALFGNYRWK